MSKHVVRVGAAVAAASLAASAQAGDFTTKRVEFVSGADRVVGTLYVPDGQGRRPAVLVEGPQTNHRDMVPAVYATRLADAGYVVLTFDHRTFGESGGEVRDFENPAMKVEDIRTAFAYLSGRSEIEPGAVGLLGVCSGAGYAAKAAAGLPGLRALVTVAGFYHDPAVFRSWLGPNYDARVALGRAARVKYEATGVVEYMKNVSINDSEELAMPGREAYDYYGTLRNPGVRWANRSATMFFEPFLQFNSIDSGRAITAATLVVHSDAALVPEGARRFYASLPGPKRLHWMVTRQHISFYDETVIVAEAVGQAIDWFDEQLTSNARRAAR